MSLSAPLLPVAAMIASQLSLCVGSSYAKTLFPVLGPAGATALRLVFAAMLLLAIARPWRWALSGRDAATIGLYGLVLGCMNLTFYLAIARIPLAIAVAIEFTGPLLLAVATSRRRLDFLWIACAVAGLGLLLPIHRGAASLDPLGVAFALAAAVCWALYIVTGQRASGLPGGQATSVGMLAAALVVLPVGAPEAAAAWGQPALLLAGALVGLLSGAIPYSLEMLALRRLPKNTFGILLSMEPAIGALVALAMLGEVLTPWQWLAIACVIVASAGSATGARREAPGVKRACTP